MPHDTDDRTAQFLHVAVQDLQQQLKTAAEVTGITVALAPAGVWLTAALQISSRMIEVSGYGTDLVTAYADLRLRVSEPTMFVPYQDLVEAGEPA